MHIDAKYIQKKRAAGNNNNFPGNQIVTFDSPREGKMTFGTKIVKTSPKTEIHRMHFRLTL